MVEIRDYQVWAKHIHGDEALKRRILDMWPGELIELEIGGLSGCWKKMEANRSTGEPTSGIKPLGKTRRYWHHLCEKRNGDLVPISEAPPSKGFLVGTSRLKVAETDAATREAPAAETPIS